MADGVQMARENYYFILGVSQSESPGGIRARYRDLVRILHPDVAGEQSTGAFQKVAEAYAVLADPLARRRHDAELARLRERAGIEFAADQSAPWSSEPVRLPREPLAFRPSFDALLQRVFWNFTGNGVPRTEAPEGLTVEVILTPEEAAHGVEVPIAVPRVEPCYECGGVGRLWFFSCDSCRGRGLILIESIARIQVPPSVHPDSIIEVRLPGLGIQNVYLRIHVRIE